MRIAALCVAVCGAAAQATVYDLRADFSTTANPNGAWSYLQGDTLLPYLDFWTTIGGVAQPAFARAKVPDPGHVPAIIAAAGEEAAYDWKIGDVVMHNWDGTSGGSGGDNGSVVWTAPYYGTIDVSGSVWLARDLGRTIDVTVFIKGTPVGTQRLTSGDEWDRAHQRALADFATGLSGVKVQAGDTVVLKLETIGSFGDFVGMNIKVDYTESPCRADCNRDGKLNINDFICMQAKWRTRDAYGDYDGSGTYTVNDFIRFQADFVHGCP